MSAQDVACLALLVVVSVKMRLVRWSRELEDFAPPQCNASNISNLTKPRRRIISDVLGRPVGRCCGWRQLKKGQSESESESRAISDAGVFSFQKSVWPSSVPTCAQPQNEEVEYEDRARARRQDDGGKGQRKNIIDAIYPYY